MARKRRALLTSAGLVLILAACGEKTGTPHPGKSASTPVAETSGAFTPETGRRLFRQHCAQCHGPNAEGDPNWRRRRPDGTFPPPPLNGTGHAWHHSHEVLRTTIRDGTVKLGGSMPGWGDKLSEAEMDAILVWLRSLWPEEIRAEWQRRQRR